MTPERKEDIRRAMVRFDEWEPYSLKDEVLELLAALELSERNYETLHQDMEACEKKMREYQTEVIHLRWGDRVIEKGPPERKP